jgi:predicted PurR-regulated permease PerM
MVPVGAATGNGTAPALHRHCTGTAPGPAPALPGACRTTGLARGVVREYYRGMSPITYVRLRKLEGITFLLLVLATTAVFIWMIRGFLFPVFWAAVFAILFQRLFLFFQRVTRGRRSVAAVLSTFSVVFLVVLPFALLVGVLARQAMLLYQRIASGEINVQAPMEFVERSLPALTHFLESWGISIAQVRTSVQEASVVSTQFIAARALSFGQNALTLTVLFGLMLYLLFFFFRDGDRIVARMADVMPLGRERKQRLLTKFAQVARATVKGNLIVAAVQGGLGAVLFAAVGIETAVFWGVVMAILSLLPAVGAGLVWLPAALILLYNGQLWQAAVVVAGGVFVIGLVDNLLRPILVGREAKMPDYLILISTLGGLTAFGLAGFVAGPVIAALVLVMWEMFAEEYVQPEVVAVTAAPAAPTAPTAPGEAPTQPAPPPPPSGSG